MDFISLLLVAIGLSFDSFAISICSGLSLCRKHLKIADALKIALTLAVFQALMPVLGWLLGSAFKDLIQSADHWIAFGLLVFLGVRMIIEGREPIEKKKVKNPLQWRVLITMAIATSIDAFAVGISFSFFYNSMLIPAIVIGVVTLIASLSGIYMGRNVGKKIAGSSEIFGGIILIIIGVKILIEHLMMA
jgi:manganese efflux pump family protein